MDLFSCLETLCAAPGAGGIPVASKAAENLLREYAGKVYTDSLGNVFGCRQGAGENLPTVMLEAHMDEIGFVVTGVDDEGFVRVAPCGGVDRRTLAACAVTFWAESPVHGVFCSVPPHLSGGEKEKLPEITDMAVDVGMSAEQARKCLPAGTRGPFSSALRRLSGSRVCGKALDDRAGVAAVLHCLELLKGRDLACDVTAVFAVQEELGCRGAQTAAFSLYPDAAVAVDVSFALTPDADPIKCGRMGDGPMIGFAPSLDNELTDALVDIAGACELPFQREVMGGDTGTDADAIASAQAGVRTALLSIPLRYMHTPVETIDLRDVENTGRLMAEWLLSRYGKTREGEKAE